MFARLIDEALKRRLPNMPAVALLGPRQVGKTTLAHALAAQRGDAVFIDMERASDRARMANPELALAALRERLVIIDEVQLAPDLFAALRPEIDADRRPGRFLLLGSAAGQLLRQSAESLAGRIAYLQLGPLLASEAAHDLSDLQRLWMRGGFPLSLLAADDAASFEWRSDFIQTFLQRDLAAWGVRTPAALLARFWTMLAHLSGQVFNASQLGQSLGGLSHTVVARYVAVLEDAMMLRRLPPWSGNVGKRLVKSPKIYVRDSGLLHALLGIDSLLALQGHPIVGASWEGFVLEQIAAHAGAAAQLSFYRTAAGAEIDVVVDQPGRRLVFEIKFSSAPKVGKGFWMARQDLQPDASYVVAPIDVRYPMAEGVEALPVFGLPEVLAG
jgi:predicted AAA+ superfamily ATPase